MRIKTLFAAILAAGLLFSGCRQDEDYVLPSLKVGTESLEFGQLSTEQVVEITASREWMVRNKPDWVAVDPASGPASATPQRVTLTVLDNTGYNRAGDVLFSIGLAKANVAVSQVGAKGEKSKGSGTLEDPYTPEGAREAAAALGADTESATDVYIKGKISRIDDKGTFTEGGTFGNASFYISEDGASGDDDFYCYRILYLGNKKFTSGTDIQVGDEVIVCGKIVNFRGNKPETVSGKAFLYSLNGVTEGGGGGNTGTPKGTGTQADPYNAAGATAAASALASGAKTETDVYVKGKISRIATDKNGVEQVFTAAYGNASFYISEDGSQNGEFYCFRVLYLGNKEWKEGDTQIKVGDEVIICGKLTNYQGTPETSAKEAYIYSLNGTTEGGGGGGGQTPTEIFSQPFKTAGQGNFTIDNKTVPTELSNVWSYDSKYGMKASGYANANEKNYDTESWLISPEIDLASATKPALSFKHAVNFFESVDKAKEEASVWVKAAGGEWTKLAGVAYPDKLSWSFVESGKIDLSAYAGKKIQVAFKYLSTSAKAGTWEVDEFLISE